MNANALELLDFQIRHKTAEKKIIAEILEKEKILAKRQLARTDKNYNLITRTKPKKWNQELVEVQ